MIVRTKEQVQQLATLLLDTINNEPVSNMPAKAPVRAGLEQAHKCITQMHTNYREIEKNLPAPAYPVQARAIAVLAVDWLQGEEMDWKRFIKTLLSKLQNENIH